jgi:hypothetical protein
VKYFTFKMNGYSKTLPTSLPLSISPHSTIINIGYNLDPISDQLGSRLTPFELDDSPNPDDEISPVSDKENGLSDRTSDLNFQSSKYV